MDFENPFWIYQNSSRDPFQALSELCTMMFLAEDELIPIGSIGASVLSILRKNGNNGDILVMTARTLALLLDKFSTIFRMLPSQQQKGEYSTISIFKALKKIFLCMLPSNMAPLKFEKSSKNELRDELVRCLTLATNATKEVRNSVPPVKVQLQFCSSVLKSSKGLACNVLRHCCTLARGGYLVDAQNHKLFGSMLIETLAALEIFEVDPEWDELLRTVTEGILTMRAWCGNSAQIAQTKPLQKGVALEKGELFESLPRKDVTHLYLKLCSRILVDLSMKERQGKLVLACANAVSSTQDLSSLTTLEDWSSAVNLVVRILQQTTDATLKISDPFVRQKKARGDTFEHDDVKLLSNLQWELPDMYWTTLIMLSKLCNMVLKVDEKYAWAWRGGNDTFYRYSPKQSAALTKSFFTAQRKLTLERGGRHIINLSKMTDFHTHTKTLTWVHFQCIPYSYRYDNMRLKNINLTTTVRLRQCAKFPELKKTLRALSFGSNEAAQLSKTIYLYLVCQDEPLNAEDAKPVFQSLLVQQPLPLLEKFSSQLLSRDTMWAPVLLESGIADALTEIAADSSTFRKRARHEVFDSPHEVQQVCSQKSQRQSCRSERSPRFKTSPVAEAIRETSSRVSLPQVCMPDVTLPYSTTSVLEFMERASYREFVSWMQTGVGPDAGADALDHFLYPILEKWLSEKPQEKARISVMVAIYTTQQLEKLVLKGVKRDLLSEIRNAKPVTVFICPPAQQSKCPKGHRMRIHFSTNWLCDRCRKTTVYGALSCRLCNYDLCYQCGELLTGYIKANPIATVGNVLTSWNRNLVNVKDSSVSQNTSFLSSQNLRGANLLYTPKCILPMSTPVNGLIRGNEAIHAGSFYSTCRCGVAAPDLYVGAFSHEDSKLSSQDPDFPSKTYWWFLSVCADEVSQDLSVTHALIEVVESYATDIFLYGLEGVPHELYMMLTHLSPFLPLSLKDQIGRFLSVDCRRYALYHIQESNLDLPGAVQGDVNSNGLPYKLKVFRGALENNIEIISQFFIKECPSLRNKLEIQFEDEEGTGTGPTREFYAELSEMYRAAKHLWYVQDEGRILDFASCNLLYLKEFYVLGVTLSRAFIDGFTMEVPLLPQTWSLLRARDEQERNTIMWNLLEILEPTLMHSYSFLLDASKEEIDAMALYDANDQHITAESVHMYVSQRVSQHFEVGFENLRALALGLLSSLDLSLFWFLSDEELSALLCGNVSCYGASDKGDRKLFSESELRAVVTEAHGYTVGAKEVEMFVSIVGGEFDGAQQRMFLEFLTGSARLPLNTLAGLGRKITIVKKPFEDKAEQMLPSCNTCFLYFKLPPYSSKEVMRERLLFAIAEGRKNFSLS